MQKGAKKKITAMFASMGALRSELPTHTAHIYSMASYHLISPLCASDVATS